MYSNTHLKSRETLPLNKCMVIGHNGGQNVMFFNLNAPTFQVLKVEIIQGLAITRGKIKDWCKYNK